MTTNILFYSFCTFILISVIYEYCSGKLLIFEFKLLNLKFNKKQSEKITSTIFTNYQEDQESNLIVNHNLINTILAKNILPKYDSIESGKLLPISFTFNDMINFSIIGELKEIIKDLEFIFPQTDDIIILSRIKCKDSLSFSTFLINNKRISSLFDLKETIKDIPDNSSIINEIIFERNIEIKFLKLKFKKQFIITNTNQIMLKANINKKYPYIMIIFTTDSDKFYSKN